MRAIVVEALTTTYSNSALLYLHNNILHSEKSRFTQNNGDHFIAFLYATWLNLHRSREVYLNETALYLKVSTMLYNDDRINVQC